MLKVAPQENSVKVWMTHMQRISIMGSTGSGKTTLARRVGERLGIPHVEMDSHRWAPNWQEVPDDKFRAAIAEATKGDAWVIDGNYSMTRDITWPRLDTVVYLDYPFWVVFWRLTRRIFRRWLSKEKLWHDNVENGWKHFFSWKDSLYVWLLKSHWRRRRQVLALMADPAYKHIAFIRLRSPKEADRWLKTLPPKTTPRS